LGRLWHARTGTRGRPKNNQNKKGRRKDVYRPLKEKVGDRLALLARGQNHLFSRMFGRRGAKASEATTRVKCDKTRGKNGETQVSNVGATGGGNSRVRREKRGKGQKNWQRLKLGGY